MINGATHHNDHDTNRIGPPAQVNHALPRQIMQKTNRVLGAVLKQRAHRSPRNQNSNGNSSTTFFFATNCHLRGHEAATCRRQGQASAQTPENDTNASNMTRMKTLSPKYRVYINNNNRNYHRHEQQSQLLPISEATSMRIMVTGIGHVITPFHEQIIQKTNRVLGAVLKQRAHRSPRNQNSNAQLYELADKQEREDNDLSGEKDHPPGRIFTIRTKRVTDGGERIDKDNLGHRINKHCPFTIERLDTFTGPLNRQFKVPQRSSISSMEN
ncbi:unnamed protein product, partial [Trichogramma brassicae]